MLLLLQVALLVNRRRRDDDFLGVLVSGFCAFFRFFVFVSVVGFWIFGFIVFDFCVLVLGFDISFDITVALVCSGFGLYWFGSLNSTLVLVYFGLFRFFG